MGVRVADNQGVTTGGSRPPVGGSVTTTVAAVAPKGSSAQVATSSGTGAAGTKLFVGSIPSVNANEESLEEFFAQAGTGLLEVVVLPPRGANPESRCAFVRVPDDETAASCCAALHGSKFE